MLRTTIVILFVIIFIKNSLFWLNLWQIKEYRLDRFFDFLTTPEGKRSFFNKSFAWELVGLIALITLAPKLLVSASTILLIVFAGEMALWLYQALKKQLKFPVWTQKSNLIFFLAVVLALAIALLKKAYFPSRLYEALLAINLLSAIWVGLIILLIYPLSYFLKQKYIRGAKMKIKNYPSLKIIGITGSYGKTSVKEFSTAILQNFFNTVKTEHHNNSEMGVARTILNHDLDNADILVAEMGAYKTGEIKKICRMAAPQVAVITGIDEQHSALFGGLAKIIKAKSEILSCAASNGAAILNFHNSHVRKLAQRTSLKKITYGLTGDKADLQGKWLSGEEDGWKIFAVAFKGGREITFKTKLIGEASLINMLASLAVGLSFGLTLEQMRPAIAKLLPPPETMEMIKAGKLRIINDSYNANPTGVSSAIKTLSDVAGLKVAILDDILELGKMAKPVHDALAEDLAVCGCAKIILTGKNYSVRLKKRLVSRGVDPETILLSAKNKKEIESYLLSLRNSTATVLLEGRRSNKYLDLLTGLYQ